MKLPNTTLLGALAVSPLLAVAGDAGIAGSDLAFLGYLAGGAVGVVAVVAWVDHRVDKRVKDHEALEEERAEARQQALLVEFRHLQGRLVDAGILAPPSDSGSNSWRLIPPTRRPGGEG